MPARSNRVEETSATVNTYGRSQQTVSCNSGSRRVVSLSLVFASPISESKISSKCEFVVAVVSTLGWVTLPNKGKSLTL